MAYAAGDPGQTVGGSKATGTPAQRIVGSQAPGDPQEANQYGTQGYRDPVTGAAAPYPTVGVSPDQMYQAASQKQSQAEAEHATSSLSAQQADQATAARHDVWNMLSPLMGGYGAGGANPLTYGSFTSATGPGSLSDAQQAAFARAKDQAGLLGKSAITGLRESMAGRGTLGSGMEGEETAKILSGAAGGLSDINRQQMIDAVDRAQHAADVSYQGGLTQRGQNIQALSSLLSLMGTAGRAY